MNQEPQAMNEELQEATTVGLEHTHIVLCATPFIEAIRASLQAGMVVVSADLRVQMWSEWAVEQWGI
ncbi:MAG: chemotaxis protein CheR, partial [Pseudonocardiales bacterium]